MIWNFYTVVSTFEEIKDGCAEPACPPDFVTTLVYAMLALFGVFGVIHAIHLFGGLDNMRAERAYTTASMVAKLSLVLILAAGTMRPGEC
jgi:hypothetical protein